MTLNEIFEGVVKEEVIDISQDTRCITVGNYSVEASLYSLIGRRVRVTVEVLP